MLTDIASEIGQHLFERAGLGIAPFRFVGITENVFVSHTGATPRAGGSCDYCGTGIRNEFWIESSDGKRSKVGCDCITKVGDSGLIRAYKTSTAFRQMQANKKRAKALEVRQQLDNAIVAYSDTLSKLPHPMGFNDRKTGKPLSWLDYAVWMMANCGDSGHASLLRLMSKALGL